MDFSFTPAEEAFRAEIREFLAREMPPGWRGRNFIAMTEEEYRVAREFDRKLDKKGWLTLTWPKEYGGQDRTPIEHLVFEEEVGYARAPNGGGLGHGPRFVGPTIIHHGGEEMKRRYLPGIASGEELWCQGFSEPNAGSDLAGLQTRAVRDGDVYIVNGEKHMVGQAQRADFCILATRTDPKLPKHKGVSLFILDMRAPGVTVRPQYTIPHNAAQWQIIMDDVRIPRSNLIGEENRGFYAMMTTLDYERIQIRYAAMVTRLVDDLIRLTRDRGGASPILRHRLAEKKIEARMAVLLNYRIAWLQSKGKVPNAEASMTKLVTERLRQTLAQTGMDVAGLYGLLALDSPKEPWAGEIGDYYLEGPHFTLAGGTPEIQRNIIAQRGLELPR